MNYGSIHHQLRTPTWWMVPLMIFIGTIMINHCGYIMFSSCISLVPLYPDGRLSSGVFGSHPLVGCLSHNIPTIYPCVKSLLLGIMLDQQRLFCNRYFSDPATKTRSSLHDVNGAIWRYVRPM